MEEEKKLVVVDNTEEIITPGIKFPVNNVNQIKH